MVALHLQGSGSPGARQGRPGITAPPQRAPQRRRYPHLHPGSCGLAALQQRRFVIQCSEQDYQGDLGQKMAHQQGHV